VSDITSQISLSVDSLTRQFNVIAHNLANISTVGYKRKCSSFAESLAAQDGTDGSGTSGGSDGNSVLDFSQGSIVESGRALDFALYGKGFFVIETPQGPLYSRNGMFRTNQNGQITDSEGRIVEGQNGPITLPGNAALSQLAVSGDGDISANGVTIGRFRIVDFKENENKLISAGLNCFLMTDEDAKPVDAENVVVKQGYLEASNVKMVDELVDMIMVSRLYEADMKLLSAQKDTAGSLMSVAMV